MVAERDTIIKEKFWYVGIVDFKDFYNYSYDLLKEEGFAVIEDKYQESIKGDSKELSLKWIATKAITDYFKITIELGWKVLGMVDVEVEMNGKKKQMNKVAELSINLKGILETDHQNKWNKNNFQKFLKEAYHKYIIPKREEDMKILVYETVKNFHNELKAFLELEGRAS